MGGVLGCCGWVREEPQAQQPLFVTVKPREVSNSRESCESCVTVFQF